MLINDLITNLHRAMRVGWQEWDKIYLNPSQAAQIPTVPNTGEDKSTDWWNTDDTANLDSSSASLPLDTWLPWSPHVEGISEITVKSCFMDHAFGYCYPNTTPEEVSYSHTPRAP